MTTKKNYKSQKNSSTEKKKGVPSSQKSFFPKMILSENRLPIFAGTIFFLFSFWFLGVYHADLLYKLQSCSLFLYNPVFAGDTFNQSAGLLVYLSRFLTQFLYYPLLGAILLSLGLSSIAWWVSRLFNIPSRYFFLSFIPSALILLAQTSIGYEVYHKLEVSIVFSLILGTLFVLLLFTFYRKIKHFRWGVWIALLLSFSFFYITGFYAFIALLMILTERIVNREKYAIPLLIGSLLVGASLPFISAAYIFQETYMEGLISPLPNPFFKGIFIFSLLSQLFLLFCPIIGNRNTVTHKSQGGTNYKFASAQGINLLLLCLSLFAVFYFSFRDSNFRMELRLQQLVEKHEWEEIIKEAEKAQEPTLAIVAYRAIALAGTGQLSQRLFDFNYQNVKPSTSAYLEGQYRNLYFYGDLCFYASFPNLSYLWSMEFWVSSGANFYLLKQMALSAMLNEEKELASKYFNLLKQSLFYKKWAEEQERYNDNPGMLAENQVYKHIKQYIPQEDFAIPIQYSFPYYYRFFKKSFTNNGERRILASLYLGDLNLFMRIMQFVPAKNELPTYVQEAILLYAILNNNFIVLESFRINKNLKEKVIRFVNEYKKYGNNKKLAEEKLKKDYKGTYCYFYFFAKTD